MTGGKSWGQGAQASRAEVTATAQGRAGGLERRNGGAVHWIAVCSWGTHCVALPKVETPDAHTFLGLGLWQRGREGDYDPFMVDGHPLSR